MNHKLVVLGLGNTLQTDEGIGIHVLNYLKRHNPVSHANYIDGGTLGFNLVAPIESAEQLIVIDTAELHAAPGTVKVFEGIEMDAFIAGASKTSAHEVGLQDALRMALLENRLPAHRALIGIQPLRFGWGDQPSQTLAHAIPAAGQKVFEISQNWMT